MFKSTAVTRSTYTQYRLNSSVVEELLSKSNQEQIPAIARSQ
ncbi:MAG: hypothetical protein QOJ99_3277 [Bryobacterales bacterium]|nr:hypothetical protein [Bryobacterales bacterium]